MYAQVSPLSLIPTQPTVRAQLVIIVKWALFIDVMQQPTRYLATLYYLAV